MLSKIVFLLFCVSLSGIVRSEFIDWSKLDVKPLNEIKEWRDVHHQKFNFAPSPPTSSENNLVRSPRIIDGEIASGAEFPYMVGILLHYDTGNSFCGGTLISRLFVLSAANCVHLAPSASALLGAANMMGNIEANIPVSRIRVHPQYSHSEALNDIATLELSRAAVLSNTIGLVRLPNRRQVGQTFLNQEGTMTGWGRTQTGNQPIPTQFLRFLRSPVISNLSCRIRFPAYITDTNVCSDPSFGTPCEGDEGGPLMITDADGRRTQIGVFSYQFSLGCTRGWPAVFARTTEYLDFIEQNSDVRILDSWE